MLPTWLIFNVLDSDGSGEVDYVEFCHHLGSCKKRDPLMMSSLTRYSVMEMRNLVSGITNSIVEVLEENAQMLHEQLELLCSVPGCEQAAKELKRRREAKTGGDGAGSLGLARMRAESAASLGQKTKSMRDFSAEEIFGEMSAMSSQFHSLEGQIESLLLKAETIREDALRNQSENLELQHSDNGSDLPDLTAFERGISEMSRQSDGLCIEARFQNLLRKLHQRLKHEEGLHKQCREIVQSIATVIENPHIVREDL